MGAIRRFLLRLYNLLRPGQAEQQLAREIAAHLTLLEDEFQRRGLSPEDAKVAARRSFGGVDQTKEVHRDERSFGWVEDARRDAHYAARSLARNPGFTVAAVLTLAVGIGGSTAVFSLINAVLFRSLPFRDPARLVVVFEDNSKFGFPRNDVRPRDYARWAGDNEVFESVAALTGHSVVLTGGTEPEKVEGRRVTWSFFPVLGAKALLGRVFSASEDRPGAPRVTILSHGLWQRRFGGDPTIIGRDIVLDNDRFVVVGVMPKEFQVLEGYVGLWVPAAFSVEELTHGSHYLTVIGRMKPGVDLANVHANLDMIGARIARQLPKDQPPPSPVIVPLQEQIAGSARRPLLFLLMAVGVVLLIACANLASLLLARAASRRHEIALRGALGASRGRILRQLLTESVGLSAMGLVLGVVFARWTFTFLEQLVPPSMTLFTRPALDGPTLALASLIALVTGILFGLAPALEITGPGVGTALRGSGRSISGAQRGRSGLVVAEVAMTLVLLVAAGLLLQTLYRLRYANLGLRPEGVLTLRTVLSPNRYADQSRRIAFYDRVLERVQRLPGVVAAGYTTSVPLEWKGGTAGFVIEGKAPDPAVIYDVNYREVSADYWKAVGIPLRDGRYFNDGDDAASQPVVIVNETMARQYWPDEDSIGQRLAIDNKDVPVRWLTIVGVVDDVRQMGLDQPVRPEMYLPYRQISTQPWFAPRDLVVRTAGDPMGFAGAIKHEIRGVDPAQPVSNIRTLDEVLDEDVAARRVGTTLLIAFAAFAVLLAAIGIYGVLAYFVVQHVPEMGLRLALGAERRDILILILGKGMKLATAGVGLGLVAAVAMTRLMSTLLYGVTGTDLTTCALGGVLLIALALVASYVPARRAARLDPLAALRSE
jgi:predicted permease